MNTALNTRALAFAGAATGALAIAEGALVGLFDGTLIGVPYNYFAKPVRGQA